jgi:GH15 family glucan-1,4-alpha-glucosidase
VTELPQKEVAMPLPIEDYAVIGDTYSAALVGRDGSIDWLCLPRFDSGACFAALLGEPRHGRWQIAPADDVRQVRRRYRGDTLVLETEFETDSGAARLVDFMLPTHPERRVVRVVEGVRGEVALRMALQVAFEYGQAVPWVRRHDGVVSYEAGPDALLLQAPVATTEADGATVAEFRVGAGERLPLTLTWFPSWQAAPAPIDPLGALADTLAYWEEWAAQCAYQGEWREAVLRSLLVLKALTYAPTGGIVAAATTSLPEQLGGVRNWDYRYCWLRDAVLTINALSTCGYLAETSALQAWLLRAIAGDPAQLQIMYGLAGERRLLEFTLDWLPGYQGAAPVRVGNAAAGQLQLDVYGEVLGAAYLARSRGWQPAVEGWPLQRAVLVHLETVWQEPDEGIWEVRGPRQHFTHSKVMAWVAFSYAARAVEEFGLPGPAARWRQIAAAIHAQVCERGYDAERGTFTQYYGSRALDASLLQIPMVGFLPADDPRVQGTVAAIERELLVDGFLLRYSTEEQDAADGLPPGEGAFLACTFWLVSVYALMGRADAARALFERLLALRNDLGLLAEEYEPRAGRQVGNFPQAFSHLTLISAAAHLAAMPASSHAER